MRLIQIGAGTALGVLRPHLRGAERFELLERFFEGQGRDSTPSQRSFRSSASLKIHGDGHDDRNWLAIDGCRVVAPPPHGLERDSVEHRDAAQHARVLHGAVDERTATAFRSRNSSCRANNCTRPSGVAIPKPPWPPWPMTEYSSIVTRPHRAPNGHAPSTSLKL